jgi:hypothetical protein
VILKCPSPFETSVFGARVGSARYWSMYVCLGLWSPCVTEQNKV